MNHEYFNKKNYPQENPLIKYLNNLNYSTYKNIYFQSLNSK